MSGAFAVRVSSNRRFVGIFWCSDGDGEIWDIDELFEVIDEDINPYECEYKWLGFSGGVISKGHSAVVPASHDEADYESVWGQEAPRFSELIEQALVDDEAWYQIEPPEDKSVSRSEKRRLSRARQRERILKDRAIVAAVYELGLIKQGEML